jgi:predicted pyridoxine 5'-phosphate oxidase superfamily flavin-nucleotide-binding protein
MSTRQTGNRAENAVMEMAEALGYCAFAARGSRGPVDIVAFDAKGFGESQLCPLAIQVGTQNKPIERTLEDLRRTPRPIGSRCIVARRRLNKSRRVAWSFHTDAGTFDSLDAAIAGRAEAPASAPRSPSELGRRTSIRRRLLRTQG